MFRVIVTMGNPSAGYSGLLAMLLHAVKPRKYFLHLHSARSAIFDVTGCSLRKLVKTVKFPMHLAPAFLFLFPIFGF